jgi:2-phospho-L-lactate guanylyltransferase
MTWALIPVKPLPAAKSRLAGVLSLSQRKRLTVIMLGEILAVLRGSNRFSFIAIVTRDAEISALARDQKIEVIHEPEGADENQAIEYATAACSARGAEDLLVLPADIPLISVAEIDALCSAPQPREKIILCPSKEGTGTNALYRKPPGVIPPLFGPDSLARHLAEARVRKVPCEVKNLPGIALDIDTPADLHELLKNPKVAAALASLTDGNVWKKW